jgi:hypothetical protein
MLAHFFLNSSRILYIIIVNSCAVSSQIKWDVNKTSTLMAGCMNVEGHIYLTISKMQIFQPLKSSPWISGGHLSVWFPL